jgi:hypothetical protein
VEGRERERREGKKERDVVGKAHINLFWFPKNNRSLYFKILGFFIFLEILWIPNSNRNCWFL